MGRRDGAEDGAERRIKGFRIRGGMMMMAVAPRPVVDIILSSVSLVVAAGVTIGPGR